MDLAAVAPYPAKVLVGRPGLSAVMVGRSAELGRLAALVDRGPAPAIAIVGGEAGVGKTRLVRELVAQLPLGTTVHAGQADPGSLGRPFDLLLDVLDGSVAASDERLTFLADRDRPTEERARLGLDILHDLTSGMPSVVVFEDLHWADAESVALFERLAEPDSGPHLLLGTYRPDALSRRHPLAELLPRLGRRHAVTYLHLDRLSIADVGAFLAAVYGRTPSYRVIEALHTRTAGNPFFLEELLAAAGEDDPDKLMNQPLPWSLGDLVSSQLGDLTTEQRCVLETAAVLGSRVPFDLLSVVSGFGEDELIGILRHLVGRGLLVEAEVDVFSFRHALAREAIESDLLGRERRRLHQAALDALRGAGSHDAAAIARHAHGAGRFDEMVTAAREGARRSLESGSTYQALQLAELGLSETAGDDDLLNVASRAAWLAGLLPDALVHAERRFEVARKAGDIEAQSAALRLVCRLVYDLGDSAAMASRTAALAALVDQLDDGPEKGKALAVLAQMRMLHEDIEGTTYWADRAIDLAEHLGLPEVRVRAEIEKGSAFIGTPSMVDEGVALLRRAIDEAAVQGQWVIVARGLHNLVRSDYHRPDAIEARSLLVRMREATDRAGFDLFAGSYWDGLADLAEWEGDLGAALTCVEEALRSQRNRVRSAKGGWYGAHAAGLALEAGEVDRAESFLDDIDPAVGRQAQWWCGLGLHIAALRHDREGMAHYAAALTAVAIDRGGTDPQQVHDVVRAMLLGGAPHSEVWAFFHGLPVGFEQPRRDDEPYIRLIHAQLLEASEAYDEALANYEAAIANAGAWVRPAALGTAHVGAGRSLLALGRLGEAKLHTAVAATLLAKWGGTRVEELAVLERRVGGGIPADGPAELTPREREVAALLAEGLSNGELGGRLFISPRTASVHVSNILAKLGMTSRAEIAAYAVRAGLADR
jgi:DNA-binding CsgD family transcriptional regulator/tetratricopeptide (TPR) repeat protein